MRSSFAVLVAVALVLVASRARLITAYSALPQFLLPALDLDFLDHPWQSLRILVQVQLTELLFSLLILVQLLSEPTTDPAASHYRWRPIPLLLATIYTVFFFIPTSSLAIRPTDPRSYLPQRILQVLPSALQEFLPHIVLARRLNYIWPFTRFLAVLHMYMWATQPRNTYLPSPVKYDVEFRLHGLECRPMRLNSKTRLSKATGCQAEVQMYPRSTLSLAFELYWQRRNVALSKHGPPASPAGLTAVALNEQVKRQSTQADLLQIKREAVFNLASKVLGHLVFIDFLDSIAGTESWGKFGPGGQGTDAYRDWWFGLGPWLIGMSTITLAMATLSMLYVVLAFVAVLVTPSTDTVFVLANWSPTWLNRPYMATTTGALWSKHWHSNLRPILVSLAHKPAHDLASVWHPRLSRPAALFASFFLSGMIHEIGFYPSARFVEVRDQRKTVGFGAGGFGATRFFLWSAVAIIAETWFKENKVERRLARLLYGSKDVDLLIEKSWMRQTVVRLWTGTILLITFRSFADVWMYHGACQGPWSFRWFARLFRKLVSLHHGALHVEMFAVEATFDAAAA